ncbi:MAG: hypothetical protein CBC01_03935 [Betaproteobacteria bacterium TMED41]|mgnify:CR=1 FL=1|nr:MAG: hypothetical protein CBC01_03935 [Betaproteobacteria bacterium TMED41]|tara:strand:+ start:329 stop:712 length:384 start_codon:yes stop_codon:yes gene_type:complete
MRSIIEKNRFTNFFYIKFVIFIFIVLNFFSLKVFSNEINTSKEGQMSLENLKIQKKIFLSEVSKKENYCLELFLSGPCLEKLIIEHDTKMREFELKKQEIARKIRRYEANLRKEKREKKLRINQNRQ